MKYYIDTEFIEDFHKPLFGKRRHFIDLISIAIVCEDGREYYAISNEFDLKKAWNKYDIKPDFGKPQGLGDKKDYWLRDNVLWPLVHDSVTRYSHGDYRNRVLDGIEGKGQFGALKWVTKQYGKSNKQIAKDIIEFTMPSRKGNLEWEDSSRQRVKWVDNKEGNLTVRHSLERKENDTLNPDGSTIIHYSHPEFYGYYSDYDWVLFCSLFGRMIDLPNGFPMYCIDLKQTFEDKQKVMATDFIRRTPGLTHLKGNEPIDLFDLKSHKGYPQHFNLHHALDDARWNRRLHEFIESL